MTAGRSTVIIRYDDDVDRWFPGDRRPRRLLRELFGRRRPYLSGMRRVVRNFLIGLDRAGVDYQLNPSSLFRSRSEKVISFGIGKNGLRGVGADAPLIAAVGFPYPSDFPELATEYNLKSFLQHSTWSLNLAKSAGLYDPNVFKLWPAGIDTHEWTPSGTGVPRFDVIVYSKVHWDKQMWARTLIWPIEQLLEKAGLKFSRVEYGSYTPETYKSLLNDTRAAIFLSPHESQGFAYQECLACNVPVFAWDPGYWMDPDRTRHNRGFVPATSVPFFDERCGMTFSDMENFRDGFSRFWDYVVSRSFQPRDFVLENLTIEISTAKMLSIYAETY